MVEVGESNLMYVFCILILFSAAESLFQIFKNFNLNAYLQKDVDFIGRDALLRQREEGVKRMYIQLLVNDHDHETDIWAWGGEPIYRNGVHVGTSTTAGYGFTFKKQVSLFFRSFFLKQF